MNAGIRIVAHGETASLEIGTDSDAARRELGAVAWSVLEVLALTGTDVEGRWVATTNSRELAARLGIGKDRAAAALGTLRQAGLAVAHPNRDAGSARFAASRYEVRLAVSRVDDARDVTRATAQADAPRSRPRVHDASRTESLDLFSSAS